MTQNNFFKGLLPHFIALGVFLVLISIYFSPALSGKILVQNDVIQANGALQEANNIYKQTGKDVLWSNSAFSGMPVWRTYRFNVIGYVHQVLVAVIPVPILLCTIAYLSFYLLLCAFRSNYWLSFTGALAFALSSFTIISIEAGHINKVFDIALMPGVLAGIVYTFRKQYWTGMAITAFFAALQIYYGHIQITYYLIYIILFYTIGQLVCHIMENKIADFFKAAALLVIAGIMAVAPNFSKLWTMAEYGKSTTRGGSELAKTEDQGGLDKDYALDWSNGQLEVFTLIVPSFYGGSSHEELSTSSESYKEFVHQGIPGSQAKEYIKSLPLYWGDQPFTSGPVYFGACIIFLFVLGLFIVEGNVKWSLFIVTILSVLLSMGKNLPGLTDFFFYNVPLYNKFRSVTMILSIAELTVPLLGFIALIKIANNEVTKEKITKGVIFSASITGGICLILALFGSSFFAFEGSSDSQLPKWLIEPIMADRASALQSDSFRSLVFILLLAGLIWAYSKDKIQLLYVYIGLALLVIVDLWAVDKRYLDKDDFKAAKKNFDKKVFVATPANDQILQDPDPNFRVFNVTQNPFSEAYTSYFHKSIGGYSGIKLARYQDLIENHLKNNNMQVLNMLNTKYVIMEDPNTKQAVVQRNPAALGNAWFVSNHKLVNTAKEEIDALKDFNPKSTAIINMKFKDELKGISSSIDSTATIKLVSYSPDELKYSYEAKNTGLAVFSEIYYQPGWNAYIDGKVTPHFQANYVLRSMVLPEGKHEIEFKFEPKSVAIGEPVSLAGSIILVLFIGFTFFKGYKSTESNSNEGSNR